MFSNNTNLRATLVALAAFGVFATHDVIVKVLGEIYSPIQIVFFSVLFGFPLLTLTLIRDAEPRTLRPRHPWWSLVRTASVVITGFSAFYAFSVLPLADAYAILFAGPLLITVLSIPILGERVGLHRGLAVIVGLIGVIVVLRPGSTSLQAGHIAALAAATGGAFAGVVVRKIGREERSAVLLLYPMLANIVVMGTLLPFVYVPMPLEHLGLLAVHSSLAFLGTGLVISAYRQGEAVIVAPMQYSQILWATAYGAILFGEWPDRVTILGAAIIILSGVYIVLRESLGENSRFTPVLRTRSRPETGTFPRVSVLQNLRWTKRPQDGGKSP